MFADIFQRYRETRQEAKNARESIRRQQAYEAQERRRTAYEREARIANVRVFTGDLKHRYVIVDVLRAHGYYAASHGETYDPTEATQRAVYQLQSQAAALGADAVIHAQYNIVRYADQRSVRHAPAPVYECHAFGTAIRIVGPPADWENHHTDFATHMAEPEGE